MGTRVAVGSHTPSRLPDALDQWQGGTHPRQLTPLFGPRGASAGPTDGSALVQVLPYHTKVTGSGMANEMKLDGSTILITGATDGLGRALALELAEPGVTLLLHGRDGLRGQQVQAETAKSGAQSTFYQADFESLAQVRRLAEVVLRDHPRLHLLVNNAGVGFGPADQPRQKSTEGWELRLGVNYLAPVLLTKLLEPALAAAAPARIVNVASIGQEALDFTDPMLHQDYSGVRAYRRSKLAMIMWTFDLAEQLRSKRITVNAVHPATFMDTRMVREAGGTAMSTVEEGVAAVLQLALSDESALTTGAFFNGLQQARANEQAYDANARLRLRHLTEDQWLG